MNRIGVGSPRLAVANVAQGVDLSRVEKNLSGKVAAMRDSWLQQEQRHGEFTNQMMSWPQ